MHACQMRLLSSCFEQSFENPAGSLICEFDFACPYSAQDDHRHDEEQANALITLILMMPQLCKISLRDWIVGYAELVSISRTCRDTLTHLSILISSDGSGVFAILNTLQKLQQLHLSVEGGPWKHSTCHPLTLTSVTNLWWNAQDSEDHTQMIRYLAQCSFGPEASFRLDIVLTPRLLSSSVRCLLGTSSESYALTCLRQLWPCCPPRSCRYRV
jgi:hypothetical protein